MDDAVPGSYSVVHHVPFDPRAHTTLQAYYSPAVAVAVAARARREWSHVSVEPAGCSPRAERGQPTEPTPARRSIVFRAGWLAVCVIPHAKPRERELLGPPEQMNRPRAGASLSAARWREGSERGRAAEPCASAAACKRQRVPVVASPAIRRDRWMQVGVGRDGFPIEIVM